jgi:hypothetical protein
MDNAMLMSATCMRLLFQQTTPTISLSAKRRDTIELLVLLGARLYIFVLIVR